ncbi:zinc ribbon domain-containing protein [Candidatus Bathycorpusculum sp.]|uniref:zinc ribbon domain-containing protein n=1 Tax=Candidatus Bathycorpusculum sp. TaxID=2994959 RepID=UPI0028304BD0|nr:zinc ribbon domain-containing protein [Candidatus Termitimicrobium sp.]MCL2685445.1 zinc ribbon domain-containing protein [Candidatus Termitimicrobium sp.]
MVFCQSCGMPLENQETKGTNKDGNKSEDYCTYCYQNGAFTQNITMDEMIENNLKYLDQWNKNSGQNLTVEEARKQLKAYMPNLKRWKQQKQQ